MPSRAMRQILVRSWNNAICLHTSTTTVENWWARVKVKLELYEGAIVGKAPEHELIHGLQEQIKFEEDRWINGPLRALGELQIDDNRITLFQPIMSINVFSAP